MVNRKRTRDEHSEVLNQNHALAEAGDPSDDQGLPTEISDTESLSRHEHHPALSLSKEAKDALEDALSVVVPLSSDEHSALRSSYPMLSDEGRALPLEVEALSVMSHSDKALDKTYRGIFSRCTVVQRVLENGLVSSSKISLDSGDVENIIHLFTDSITLIRDLKCHIDTLRMNAVTRRINPRAPFDVSGRPTLFASRLGANGFQGIIEAASRSRQGFNRAARPRFRRRFDAPSAAPQPAVPSTQPQANTYTPSWCGRGRGGGSPGRQI